MLTRHGSASQMKPSLELVDNRLTSIGSGRDDVQETGLAGNAIPGEHPPVQPSGEGPTGTLDDHDTDVRVQPLTDLPQRLPRARKLDVEHVGAVQRDRRARAVDVKQQATALQKIRVNVHSRP